MDHLKRLFFDRKPPRRLGSKAGPILYHYTGYPALTSIVERQELWASNIHFLNDEMEFKHGFEYLSDSLDIYLSQRSVDPNEVLRHFNDCVENLDRLRIHIISFSEVDDMLSQWRGYTPSGGVSLGFGSDHLNAICQKMAKTKVNADMNEPREPSFQLMPCIYTHEDKSNVCNQLIEGSFYTKGPLPEGENLRASTWKFVSSFSVYASLFKHEGFSEEREWRLVSGPIDSRHEKVGFYAAPGFLRPHFKFGLKLDDDSKATKNIGLQNITVSPTVRTELMTNAISDLFARYNVKWGQLAGSSIPYRSL